MDERVVVTGDQSCAQGTDRRGRCATWAGTAAENAHAQLLDG